MKNTSALIILLLSVGIFYTFTSPQYSDAQALSAQASEYRDVVANVSRIQESRDNLLNSFEAIPATEKDRLMKILPNNVDSIDLARDLDTIASRYGISIKTVQVNPTTENNARNIVVSDRSLPYESTLVAFSFISSYPNFIKFLGDMEKSLRIMDVRSVTFQTGESGLYEHQVTFETYWLKQ